MLHWAFWAILMLGEGAPSWRDTPLDPAAPVRADEFSETGWSNELATRLESSDFSESGWQAAKSDPGAATAKALEATIPDNPDDASLLDWLRENVGFKQIEVSARDLPTLGKMATTKALQAPLEVGELALQPVMEANLLLPPKLNPFEQSEQTLNARLSDEELAKQRKLLGGPLAARTNLPPEKAYWYYSVSSGGSFRQGNSSNTNMNALANAERHSRRGDILGKIGADYNQNGDDDPNHRVNAQGIIDRNLRGRWICYTREDALYDRATLIDFRNVLSAGLGFRFFDEPDRNWLVRVGPTISYVIWASAAETPDQLRGGWLVESDYRKVFSETVRFEWTTSLNPEFDNDQQFRVHTEAALLFPIGGAASRWHWKIGAKHDYLLDPPPTVHPNDFQAYFSVAYTNIQVPQLPAPGTPPPTPK